jgi:hypothetical protein
MANQTDRAEFLERAGEAMGTGQPDGVEAAYGLITGEGAGLSKAQRWKDACAELESRYAATDDVADVEGHQRWAVLRAITDLTAANT